jgi:hypothetical protein
MAHWVRLWVFSNGASMAQWRGSTLSGQTTPLRRQQKNSHSKPTQLKVLVMKMSDAFPSKYFTGASLTKPVAGTINVVIMEAIGQPAKDKPVLYFKGHDKGLVINKTNFNALASMFGDDSDNWRDKRIVLYSEQTSYQGKTVTGIRVRKAETKLAAEAKPATKPAPASVADVVDELDDSVDDIGDTI